MSPLLPAAVVASLMASSALLVALLSILPKPIFGLRVAVWTVLFVSIREAMVPLGVWWFTPELEMRFVDAPGVLAALGVGALAFALAVYRGELVPPGLVRGFAGSPVRAVLAGLGGAALIALPARLAATWLGGTPVEGSLAFLAGLLVLCIGGCVAEELIFRGLVQGLLLKLLSPERAIVASAFAFCASHGVLAASLADSGLRILGFTLIEGVVCGLLAHRHGLVASVLAHGLSLLVIGAGLP